MRYDRNKKISCKDLKEGGLYVLPTGEIWLYVGRNTGNWYFYLCGSVVLTGDSIYNWERCKEAYYIMCHINIVSAREEGVRSCSRMPTLLCCIEDDLEGCKVLIDRYFGRLLKPGGLESVKPSEYKLGELYVSSEGEFTEFSDVYKYLGRSEQGYWRWAYVGKVCDALRGMSRRLGSYNLKSPKKVVLLNDALGYYKIR